ncbi:MAG TPA: thiamine pyrophosphate-dependent enzyme, partial [Leptospiraceae bacterium]|nr:thiamine pyrophosphate-dependent enzyme [Leptospiraceae bacterium]
MNPDLKIRFLRAMLHARISDEAEQALKRKGLVPFELSSEGHEALAAIAFAMGPDDWLHPHYRDRAIVLARGVSDREIFLDFFSRSGAPSAGRQMPVHYNSRALRIVTLSTPVATNALQAAGMALSLKERGIPEVVIASIGDASSREGEFYEALAMAAADQLPVVFVIEDNGYGISTPTAGRTFWKMKHGVTENSDGSWFHGCAVLRVDGLDPEAVYEATLSAIDQARSGAGPTILIANVERLKSHSSSDDQRIYRSADELEHLKDPVKLYMQRCLDSGIVDQRAIAVMRQELHDQVNEAARQAIGEGEPDPGQEIDSVFAPLPLSLCNAVEKLPRPLSKDEGGRTMAQCIELVLEQEMKGNDRIYLYGEDIEDPKGDVFGITRGLSGKFPGHVRNSPLAEATIVGSSVGRALAGDLPVAAIQFIDFVGPALNQLFNEVITIYWRSAGQWNCPILILSPYGAYAPGIGPWHSQTNEALFAHMPGLHVVIPSSPADAAGLLRFSLRCQRPVLFLYPKRLLHTAENTVEIPPEDCMVPFGRASVLRRGKDVTLVTWGNCVSICLSAASVAHAEGIECEIIDLRTIIPWDRDAVLKSVRNTGRLIVVHEDARTCGFGSEIVAEVVAECFDSLISPPTRVTKGDVHNPYNMRLQLAALPSVEQTAAAVRSICQSRSDRAIRKERMPESHVTMSAAENVVNILVPQQSPTDEDAHLICFRVQLGDDVTEGAVVAEMEANKGAFEIESTHSGRVIALHGSPGSRMLIGEKLLTLEVSSHNTKSQTPGARGREHQEHAGKEQADGPNSAIVKLSPAQIRVSRIARMSLREI